MSQAPERLALGRAHRQALGEALDDLRERDVKASELENLDKADRRLLDQFAYRCG